MNESYALDGVEGEAALRVLTWESTVEDEVAEQARRVEATPARLAQLADDALLRLGARLARIGALRASEEVLEALDSRSVRDDRFPVLAQRLAAALQKAEKPERAAHWAARASQASA